MERDVNLMSLEELKREVEKLRARIRCNMLDEARIRREALEEARRELASGIRCTDTGLWKGAGR